MGDLVVAIWLAIYLSLHITAWIIFYKYPFHRLCRYDSAFAVDCFLHSYHSDEIDLTFTFHSGS